LRTILVYSIIYLSIFTLYIKAQIPARTAQDGDRLKMGYVLQTQPSFNPMLARTEYDIEIVKLIHGDGLFIIGPDGQTINGIALSSKQEDDQVWTITLQPDIYFHDRTPLRAEDVKFSYELYRKFAYQSSKIYMIRYVEKIEVLSTYTVRFVLRRPMDNFKTAIGMLPILPERHYDEWESYDDVYNLPFVQPVGIGPFMYRRMPDYQIHLDANRFYFRKQPFLEGIDIHLFDTYDELLNAFVQDRIDIMEVEDKNIYRKINQITDGVKFSWVKRDNLKLYYIVLNTRRRPFNETRIRKALTQAINKNLLVERNLPEKSYMASNVLEDNSEFFLLSTDIDRYDPLNALSILRQSGFVRQRNGKMFRNGRELKFDFYFQKGSSFEESIVRLISISLGELGINVIPRPLMPTEIENRISEGNYEAILRQYIYNPQNSEPVPREFYLEELNNLKGFKSFSERRIDVVIDRSEKTYTLNEILPNLQRIQYLFNEYSPCVFLFFENRTYYAINSRFENTREVFREDLKYQTKLTPKYEWYVPEEKQKY
jgi:peptide/nickel transport system substrate-binding protein